MQLVKGIFFIAVAATLCFVPTTATNSVDVNENTPNVRKLYYTKFPTPSPEAPAKRQLYYTKFPTPSPAVQ
ncbi:hypothetical protein PHMEG_00026035 [Phytophthora megakarya]|uniref:RxLR effector protein n=1 Tax=Phytophthora megakarya TaxID=4795 RepID=A0A225VAP8_9STRA|nr:hypothetical protein PHMEG_00026035 [Phytophthora megakarya]